MCDKYFITFFIYIIKNILLLFMNIKRLKYVKLFEDYQNRINKRLEEIKTKFKCDYVAKKAVELNYKLAKWIIKTFKNKILNENPEIRDELELYFKTGKNEQKYFKFVVNKWNELSPKYQMIIDWSKSYDIREEERRNLKKFTFEEALKRAEQWHNQLKASAGGEIKDESGTVLMRFPDGFYWIDLETNYDRCEGEAMGHCGRTSKGDTLYSLRDKYKRPHVTAAVDTVDGIIYQMKGKQNTKPNKRYHKYIVALLTNDDLPVKIKGFASEYDRASDFTPSDLEPSLYDELLSKRPDIDKPIFTDEEINDLYYNYLKDMYEQDHSFQLIKRLKDLYNIDHVIETIDKNNGRLFDILCEEYNEKVYVDIIDEEKLKIIFDILNFNVSANRAAEYFNITLPNPKDSNTNKWNYIIKHVSIEKLEELIKKENLNDEYEEMLPTYKSLKKKFTEYKKVYSGYILVYDYYKILNYFFDHDDNKIFKGLEELFDNGKYSDEVFDIWIISDVIHYISVKTSREEKENEMTDYLYY